MTLAMLPLRLNHQSEMTLKKPRVYSYPLSMREPPSSTAINRELLASFAQFPTEPFERSETREQRHERLMRGLRTLAPKEGQAQPSNDSGSSAPPET